MLIYGPALLSSCSLAVTAGIFTGGHLYLLQWQLHTGGPELSPVQKSDFLLEMSTLSLVSVWNVFLPCWPSVCLTLITVVYIFILDLAFTLALMCCFILIIERRNYEKFLIKRLFSFSKKLFNCSTQPYQRKSRCPCQKTRVLLTTRHQRTVFHRKLSVQSLSPYRCLLGQSGDVKWKLYLLTEALIGSSAVKRCCVCGDTMHGTYFLKEAKEQKGHKGYRRIIVEKHNKTQRSIKLARLFICLAELCFRRLLEGWKSGLLQQNPC